MTLAVAMSVLAGACAIFQEPIPPGTVPHKAVITNKSPNPVEFTVRLGPEGGPVLAGAAQPASIPAGPSTTTVTFYLPPDHRWVIDGSGWGELLAGRDFGSSGQPQCPVIHIDLDKEGGWGFSC